MKIINQAVLFLRYLSTGLLVPILSLLLIEKGCSLAQIALIFGVNSLTIFILEVPSGMLADIYGRKRIFLLSGFLNLIFSVAVLFFSGFTALIPIVVLMGAGRAMSSGTVDALMIDEYINEYGTGDMSKLTMRLQVIEIGGLSLGTVIGGFLPTIAERYFSAVGRYDINLIARAGLCFIYLVLGALYVKEDRLLNQHHNNIRSQAKNSFKVIIENKAILLLIISYFLTGFFVSSIETYWQPVYTGIIKGAPLMWTLGLIALGGFLFAGMGNIVFKHTLLNNQNHMAHKYLSSRILLFGLVIIFSGMRTVIGFSGIFFLIYFFFGGTNMLGDTMLNIQIPNNVRSSLLSIASLTFFAGSAVSMGAANRLLMLVDIRGLWIVYSAGLILLTIVAGLLLIKAYPKHVKTKKETAT